jgi:hypothetical protein
VSTGGKYTCAQYREEMLLLSLERRLNEPGLSDEERDRLAADIGKLRRQMDMD